MVPLKQRQAEHAPSNRPTSRARYAEDTWANLSMPLPHGNPMARRRISTRKSEFDLTTTSATTAASDRSVILEEAQASVTRYYAQAKELDDQLANVRQERNELAAKIQELQASHEKQLNTLIVKIDDQKKLIKRYQSLGDVDELEHLQVDDTVHVQQLRDYKDRVLRLEEELSKAKDQAQDDRDDALAYENLLVERNNQINTLQSENEQHARRIAQLEQQIQADKSSESMYVQQLRECKDRVAQLEEDLAKANDLVQQEKGDAIAYENALTECNSQIDALQSDNDQQSRTIAQLEQRVRDAEQAEKDTRNDVVTYKNLLIDRNSKINTLQTENEQLSRRITELEERVQDTAKQVQVEKDNESMQAQQLHEYKERLLRLEQDLAKAKDQIQHDRDDAVAYENAIAERNDQINALQADSERQSRIIVQLEQRIRDAEQQMALEKSNQDDVTAYKNLLSEHNGTIKSLQDENTRLSREIIALEQAIGDMEQNAREKKKILEDELADIRKSYKDTSREAEELKGELKRLMLENKKATTAYEEIARELDELRNEHQRALIEKKKITNELERAHSTLKHAQKKDDIINTLYAARSNLSRELTETASHLNQMAEEAARREQQLSSMEEARRQELNAAKEHERELSGKIAELEKTIAGYEKQLSNFGTLEQQMQDQNAYIDELQDALHEREARMKEVQHAADIAQDDLAHSKEALDKALVHVERLEHELNGLNDERRKKTEQIARLHNAVAKAEEEQKRLEVELTSRQQDFKRVIAERDETVDHLEQTEKSLAEAHRTIDDLEKHLQEAQVTSRAQEEERIIRIGQLERSVERILEDLELTRTQLGDAERVRGTLQDEIRRLRIQIKEHENNDEDRARLLARSQRKLAALQEENKNWLLQLQQAETEAVRLRQVLGDLTKYGEEALAQ